MLGPERRCVVARELTKLHEDLFRTTLGGAAEHYSLNAPRVRFRSSGLTITFYSVFLLLVCHNMCVVPSDLLVHIYVRVMHCVGWFDLQ